MGTAEFIQLANTPDSQRDESWEAHFLKALTESSVQVLSPDPQTGPDGWPYLMVGVPDSEDENTESAQKILHWLSRRGMGLVVNPSKQMPDYILTYGMIWSFRETGYFFKPKEMAANLGKIEFDPKSIRFAGEPTPDYLPDYVRQILRDFFRDQGLLSVKILVMSSDEKNYDLAVSLESLGNPPSHEHAGIAEAIGWFLPPHYSILLISEKGLPVFTNL